MFGALAGQVLGQGMKEATGGPMQASQDARSTSADYINIAPIGVNFGEIMRPFNESGVSNGGYGLQLASRFTGSNTQPTLASSLKTGSNMLPLIIIGGGVGILALLFFMR